VTGEGVTPATVINGLQSSEVAHISSHGFVDTTDPLGSGLLLSDGKRRPSRQTQSVPIFERPAFELTVRQLMEQKLDTQLLTLRACSTARRSSVAAKTEMSTLTRVLHAAGCRTVISTLWNVDQRSSLQLFERFYSMYLDAEMPPCDAMAQAQRELLSSGPPHNHLYHWAPFVLSGDWRRP
jgi:CHAT domain-containing protein